MAEFRISLFFLLGFLFFKPRINRAPLEGGRRELGLLLLGLGARASAPKRDLFSAGYGVIVAWGLPRHAGCPEGSSCCPTGLSPHPPQLPFLVGRPGSSLPPCPMEEVHLLEAQPGDEPMELECFTQEASGALRLSLDRAKGDD